MVCPNCKITPLSVVNENYYCPKCKLFIGSVKSNFVKENAVSSKVVTDAPIKDVFTQISLPRDTKDEKPKVLILKRILQVSVPVLFLGLLMEGWFILSTVNSYVDVGNFCKIDITDSRNSDEVKSVINSINILKRNDADSYKNLCGFVDQIGLGGCQYINKGCFFKGSKTIYLRHGFLNEADLEVSQAIEIRKYAQMSKEYWSSSN